MKVLITFLAVILFAQAGNRSENQALFFSPPVNFPAKQPSLIPNRPTTEKVRLVPPRCPDCKKNTQVVPIYYGFPDPEIRKRIDQDEAVLGGCMMGNTNPHWYCKRDREEF